LSRRIWTVVLVAAAGLGAWALAHRLSARPLTDEEQIRALFQDAVRAVGERQVGDAVAGVSERFQGEGGLDKRAVKQLIAAEVFRGEWVTLSIAGLQVDVDGARAKAVLDVVMARSGKGADLAALLPGDAAANRFSVALEREQEGWRIIGATRREVGIRELLEGTRGGAAGASP
jgi:hypothetical protein